MIINILFVLLGLLIVLTIYHHIVTEEIRSFMTELTRNEKGDE